MGWPDDPYAQAPEGPPPTDDADFEAVVGTTPDTVTYANGVTVPRGVSPVIDAHARAHEARRGHRAPEPLRGAAGSPEWLRGLGAPGDAAPAGETWQRGQRPDLGGEIPLEDGRLPPGFEQRGGVVVPVDQNPGLLQPEATVAGGIPTSAPMAPHGPAGGQAPSAPGAPVGWRSPAAPVRAGGGGGLATRTATTVETQRGTPVEPALESDIRYQQEREQQAAAMQAGATGEAAKRTAALQQRVAQDAQRIEAERRQHEADRQKAADEALSGYRDAVRQAGQAQADPDHWFASRGTGGQILAALAVGLGTFGSSITGAHNDALALVQDAISRDMEAQRENARQAGESALGYRGILSAMREKFGDERQAELAAEAAMYQQAETEARGIAAQAGAEGAGPEAEQLISQLAQRHDMILAQLGAQAADHVTVRTATQQVPVGGGGRGRLPLVPGLRPNSEAAAQLSSSDLGKVRARAAMTTQALAALDRMIALRERTGAEVLDRSAVEQGQTDQEAFLHALAAGESAGALGDREYERYQTRVPDPTAWSPWQLAGQDPTMDRLRALRREVAVDGNAYLRGYGWEYDPTAQQPQDVTGAVPGLRPAGGE